MSPTQCYECLHQKIDTGDKALNEFNHDIWREAGLYSEDCYDGKSDVNLKNCSYGCFKSHSTGSFVEDGKWNYNHI